MERGTNRPGPEQPGSKDLQKEFHRILSELGPAAADRSETLALKFLLENYDRNPSYAEKQALKLSSGLNETLRELLFRTVINGIRADLYSEFGKLSERQKTKLSGFKGFVKKYLEQIRSEGPDFTTDEQKFSDALLEGTERETKSREYLGEVYDVYTETRRPHYRKLHLASLSALQQAQEKLKLIREIVERGQQGDEPRT